MKQGRRLCNVPWHQQGHNVSFPPIEPIDTLDAKAWDKPRLTTASQALFLEACWNFPTPGSQLERELQPYSSYMLHYEKSCLHIPATLRQITHRGFCKAVQCLPKDSRKSCENAIQSLPEFTGLGSNVAKDCIDFLGKAIPLLDLSEWKSDETMNGLVVRVIASDSKETDRFQLPVSFNARTFEKIANVEIRWTRDLMSHLKVGPNMSSLCIFHHVKIFDLYECSGFADVFPDHFITETRSTLSLILPIADQKSRQWFAKKQQRLALDEAAGNCPYLRGEKRRIEYFNYWRDRLIIAKEMFDSSQPGNLVQFWRDDRNVVQWWTFWIAIVVFLLTLVGVVESALQVYKAYYPSR